MYAYECVPCPEGDLGIALPDGDVGVPFLNEDRIAEEQGYYLNQDRSGRFTIYTNEDNEIGVRVVNYFGNPVPGVQVNFQILEPDPARPSGAQLRSRTVASTDFGMAKVVVRGGPQPAFIQLQISAENTRGLTYNVNVVQRPSIDAPGSGGPGPVGGRNCLRTKGTYDIVNRYQPASVFGDDLNNSLMTIRQLLTDPGDFVADLVADRIGGIGGAIAGGLIRAAVNYAFSYVVNNYLPDWAQRTVNITRDVTGILTDLEIHGTMQLGDEDPMACTLEGIHRWETLYFIWRVNCPPNDDQCGRHPIPMRELGISASESEFSAEITDHRLTDTMIINEHQLQMNLGVALVWFLERTVLPNYFNNVNSFGDLLAMVIPCDVVGDLVADRISIPFVNVSRIVEQACRSGLEAAGQELAQIFAESLNIDTFAMTGECKLRDTDRNETVDKIQDGVWGGQLLGTFSGQRQGANP